MSRLSLITFVFLVIASRAQANCTISNDSTAAEIVACISELNERLSTLEAEREAEKLGGSSKADIKPQQECTNCDENFRVATRHPMPKPQLPNSSIDLNLFLSETSTTQGRGLSSSEGAGVLPPVAAEPPTAPQLPDSRYVNRSMKAWMNGCARGSNGNTICRVNFTNVGDQPVSGIFSLLSTHSQRVTRCSSFQGLDFWANLIGVGTVTGTSIKVEVPTGVTDTLLLHIGDVPKDITVIDTCYFVFDGEREFVSDLNNQLEVAW